MVPSLAATALTASLGTLLESPVWWEPSNEVTAVDIPNGRIWHLHPETGSTWVETLRAPLSAAVPAAGGTALAFADGIWFRTFAGDMHRICDTRSAGRPTILNDAKADPLGRLWVGRMSPDERPGAGSLLRIDQDGSCREVLTGLAIPNGLDWSADGSSMYFIDSPTRRIAEYEVTPDGLGSSRTVTQLTLDGPLPDGLCTDTGGGLWVALNGGGQVNRYATSGELTFSVHVPVPQVTSCCFGGPTRSTLYITTAREHLSAEEAARQPLAGALFEVSVPFQGQPCFEAFGPIAD